VAKNFPGHLKLHVGESSEVRAEPTGLQTFDVDSLYSAFAEATGWRVCPALKHSPSSLAANRHGSGDQPKLPIDKRLKLVPDAPMDGMLDITEDYNLTSEVAAWRLLTQLDSLVQSLANAEAMIQRQEAQLASSVGVNIRPDESEVLASKLQETLNRAVVQTCSDAAAIYLLDENTSELKMRSCLGLPTSALYKPPRQLRGSMADLEALLGNAVLLENTDLAKEWGCPENFSAALCLPIGSPTMPHGTLWLWSEHVRDFTTDDIESAKAAAEKILVDIERTILADEVLKTRSISRGVEAASLIQATRLPDAQPLHIDYEIGGWTFQGQSLGGNFHSWNYNRQGEIVAAIGDAELSGTSGAIVATTLQTIVETCWNAKHEPKQVLRKSNDMLWAAEDGDWRCSLAYLKLDPTTGEGSYGLSGSVQAYIVGVNGYRMLAGTPTLLGQQPDTTFENHALRMEGGDLLVFASQALMSGILNGGLTQAMLLETLQAMHDEPVDQIVDHLARQLPLHPGQGCEELDRSLLILRRRF
jgi:phosphoserine phosphatase RsbU/P